VNAPRTRVQRRPVHGVLLLDKPLGLSSNDALQKAKWLLRAEKAGHTGTLDPMATGVLPLCFGAATKFSQLHLDADKSYEAVARLGLRTSSGDSEGEVIERREVPAIAPGQLAEVQAQFTGPITQIPPMHSALKKDGKALYEYARAGLEVEREARGVTIFSLQLTLLAPDLLKIVAKVSKGTYIRTLGEDLGAALGCGASLVSLRRIATGPFDVSQCLTLAELEALPESDRSGRLLPVESLLPGHARVTLGMEDAGRFLSGLRRRGSWADAADVAVFAPSPDGGEPGWGRSRAEAPPPRTSPAGGRSVPVLLGTGHVKAGELIPTRLLSPIEIQQILGSEEPATV
jgi:tRNA pseudouridine55 synthase